MKQARSSGVSDERSKSAHAPFAAAAIKDFEKHGKCDTRSLLSHSGSMPSSILSGTPDAPDIFAAWLSESLLSVFGLSRTEGTFAIALGVFLGDSPLIMFCGVAWPAG